MDEWWLTRYSTEGHTEITRIEVMCSRSVQVNKNNHWVNEEIKDEEAQYYTLGGKKTPGCVVEEKQLSDERCWVKVAGVMSKCKEAKPQASRKQTYILVF